MRQLGELEAVVMDRLWTWDRPVPVRAVLGDLQRDRAIAYTTVMTVLDNLHRKGFVTREKDGRAYHYHATTTREQHTAALMEQVLAGSSDRGAALLHFVERMPAEEIGRLREALKGFGPDPEETSR
ncbi:MAG: BlaI/MecI/CopY family transcriptional regulator [Nocardioidaceae bacterium]|nr:BlaI/MecI/CopY family transcriptional regulator [Nocardioidaceae bacterium]